MKTSTVLFIASTGTRLQSRLPADNDQPAPKQPKFELKLKDDMKWHLLGHSLAAPVYFLPPVHAARVQPRVSPRPRSASRSPTSAPTRTCSMATVSSSAAMNARGSTDTAGEAWLVIAPTVTEVLLFTAADLTLTYGVDDDSPAAPFLLFGGHDRPAWSTSWSA